MSDTQPDGLPKTEIVSARPARKRPRKAPVAKEKDRPLHLQTHGAVWCVGLGLLAVMFALSFSPTDVEQVYTEGIGQLVGRFLAAVSGVFPFSLFEFLLLALLVWAVASCCRALYLVARRQRRLLNALGRGAILFLTVVLLLTVYFYFAWGLNYARAELVTRLGWQDLITSDEDGAIEDADIQELTLLCAELVDAANAAYAQAHGTDDLGRPSAPPSLRKVDKVIDRAYDRVARRLRLHSSFAVSRGRAKPVTASWVMCYMLMAGFYNPWTGEANFNRLSPAAKLPHVIAHEKAHQRGVTSEDEANFFGYLACVHSDDPYVRYSGYLFAQQQLLRELLRLDKDRGKALIQQRYPGVQRDVDAERAFWKKYHGKVAKVSHAVNNAYLKANRVKGGALSYRMSARLLVLFARQNNDSCLVERPAG